MNAPQFAIDSESNWSYQLVRPMPAAHPRPEFRRTTQIDAVFEKLLSSIVSGTYTAGSRLPAERELSRQLGASRADAARGVAPVRRVEPRRAAPWLGHRRPAVSRLVDRSDRAVPALRQARARPAEHRPDPARPPRDAPRGRARGHPADRAADPERRHRGCAGRDGARVVAARFARSTSAKTSR